MFRARRTRYAATVKSVSRIAPRMARISLEGPGMSAFRCDEPTQWVKLFVTDPLDGQTVGRAYTVRHYSSAEPRIDIDVVLHGKGPAARWAEAAEPGQEVSFGDPRGPSALRRTPRSTSWQETKAPSPRSSPSPRACHPVCVEPFTWKWKGLRPRPK